MTNELLNRERQGAGPAPFSDGFAVAAKAAKTGRVDVIHGVYAHSLPLAGMTVAQAQSALLDRSLAGGVQAEAFSTLKNPGTIYSVVVDPLARQCWLRANDRPERQFVKIDAAAAWKGTAAVAAPVHA